ncbi:MAG: UPF0175 family protein [Verrucomicrobiae bacterium]|nr:UPF0175 family protein [Verrucomicrobiae bacterium]
MGSKRLSASRIGLQLAHYQKLEFFIHICYDKDMPIDVTIPDELLNALPNDGVAPDRRVLESFVLELYREDAISAGKVAQVLGLNRIEADRFLASHHLSRSPSSEVCARDRATLESLLSRG